MTPLTRGLVIFIAWSAVAALLAPICFFAVILLAGPHSSMLPSAVQPAVLVLGWAAWIVAPIYVARRIWQRTRPSPPAS
jgi:hypothetical protein